MRWTSFGKRSSGKSSFFSPAKPMPRARTDLSAASISATSSPESGWIQSVRAASSALFQLAGDSMIFMGSSAALYVRTI